MKYVLLDFELIYRTSLKKVLTALDISAAVKFAPFFCATAHNAFKYTR